MNVQLDFHSHRTQLICTAVAASLATAGLLSAFQRYNRQQKRRELDESIHRSISGQEAKHPLEDLCEKKIKRKSKSHLSLEDDVNKSDISLGIAAQLDSGPYEYDEELVREQLARNYAFFGEEGMAKIRKGMVVVIGCGGVGSWAAIMLARSGVSKIRLVDFDYVTLSSLNRHAAAVLSDVGTPKVKCIERTLKQISRWIEVDSRVDIWRKDQGGELLEGADWVIDAIDNITTKVDLLKYCHDHNIKVFSSMGSGAKSDPTRVQISDISCTMYDPLARSVRRGLRLEGIASGIPVVYSTEVPGDVKLLPLPEDEFEKGDVRELGVFDDFRVRIIPVIGPLPSIFGLNIATYILCELAGKPITNPLPVKFRKKLYERLYRELLHREEKLAGEPINKLPIDEDDVGLIFEDIHRGRSVIPPYPVPSRPTLVRWDPAQPLSLENCVPMEHAEAERHVAECYGGSKTAEELWGAHAAEVVSRRREEIRKVREWVL
ncbi:ubiquitin-protein ligase molybdopterin-converting factor [Sparassis latifolia]